MPDVWEKGVGIYSDHIDVTLMLLDMNLALDLEHPNLAIRGLVLTIRH